MRGQIPIAVAVVIVCSVMIASLHFITTLNVRSYVRPLSYASMEWLLIDAELDTLAHIALKHASEAADQRFSALCDEASGNFNLEACLAGANQVLMRVVHWILGNWSTLKTIEGYAVVFQRVSGSYYVGRGYGHTNLSFTAIITNPSGESRAFTKRLSAYLYASVRGTELPHEPPGLNLNIIRRLGIREIRSTYVYNLTALIVENNELMYYYLSPKDFDSIALKFRHRFLTGRLRNLTYAFDAAYYRGRGENIAVSSIVVQITSDLTQENFQEIMKALIELHKRVKGSTFTVAADIAEIRVRAIITAY